MGTDLQTRSSEALPQERQPALVYLARLSENGRRGMTSRLQKIATVLGIDDWRAVPWHELRFQHVQAVITKLREAGQAPASVNMARAAMRGVAQASFNLGFIGADELERIRSVKLVPGSRLPRGRALSAGELAAMMGACADDDGAAGVRDGALIGLMFAAGLRRAEVAALDVGDYDAETGRIVVRGKGDKERETWINNGAADALADWLLTRGDAAGPMFVPINKGGVLQERCMTDGALYDMLRKRARQAGVAEVTPHDLRRTFVSELLDAGADIAVVAGLAGHASVTTTARYDRRDARARQKATGLLHLPYQRRSAETA